MEQIKTLSKPIIKIKNIELVNFSVLFTALAVALPWLAHQFHLAGPTFLPMHLFVFIAALLLGWRAGLMVGILTPIVSFTVSGMPLPLVLPQIIIELAIYGLIAGFCREKLGLNLWLSLIIAMLAGRLSLGLAVWTLGTNPAGPINQIVSTVKLGWPGILIQLALVPLIVILLKRYSDRIDDKQDLPPTRREC